MLTEKIIGRYIWYGQQKLLVQEHAIVFLYYYLIFFYFIYSIKHL